MKGSMEYMTEKRFSCTENGFVVDYESEHKLLNLYDVVDCLNALSDENEQLKSDVQMCREKALYWRNKAEDIFGDMKTNIELKQENEQLKQQIADNGVRIDFLSVENKHMYEVINENEQLKKQIKQLKEDIPLLLGFYRWYPFAVTKDEHSTYNRLWDFVNDGDVDD